MTKIEKLTAAQKAKMPEYVKTCIEIGLDTSPIDFELAEQSIRNLVKVTNKAFNKKSFLKEVFYARSPMEAFKMVGKNDVNSFFSNCIWGQHDSDWVGFYSFMKDELQLSNLELIDSFAAVVKTCGWVHFTFDNTAIIIDRPEVIYRDLEGRVHGEHDLAIKYRDGWGVAMWHGQRIPREWILEPESLTAEVALTWKNADQQSAACEIVGWINVLDKLNARTLDKDEDPMTGELVEVDLPDSDGGTYSWKFLVVRCPTERDFAIPVPENMKTALQANAWTWGMEEHEYRPEVQT